MSWYHSEIFIVLKHLWYNHSTVKVWDCWVPPSRCVDIFLSNHFDGSPLALPSSADFLSATASVQHCRVRAASNDRNRTTRDSESQILKSFHGRFYSRQVAHISQNSDQRDQACPHWKHPMLLVNGRKGTWVHSHRRSNCLKNSKIKDIGFRHTVSSKSTTSAWMKTVQWPDRCAVATKPLLYFVKREATVEKRYGRVQNLGYSLSIASSGTARLQKIENDLASKTNRDRMT